LSCAAVWSSKQFGLKWRVNKNGVDLHHTVRDGGKLVISEPTTPDIDGEQMTCMRLCISEDFLNALNDQNLIDWRHRFFHAHPHHSAVPLAPAKLVEMIRRRLMTVDPTSRSRNRRHRKRGHVPSQMRVIDADPICVIR